MKYSISILLLASIMSAIPGQGYAQPPGGNAVTAPVAAALTRIPVRADSRLWLEGSSNVRDWTCKATAMDASIEIDPAKARAATLDASAVRGVKVKVPVRMLKCGDRHMEAHMYTALKAPPEPAESFITATLVRLPAAGAAERVVEVSGNLRIAGVERFVSMTITSDRMPDGTHRARGTVPIRMTDFGIKPPRPWGGILRTADKVLIQFEIFIAPMT